MGEWSEYFEDFPEENPENQTKKPSAFEIEQIKETTKKQKELQDEIKEITENAKQKNT